MIGIVLLALALFWIFFPVVVWGKLNAIIKHLQAIEDATEETARNSRLDGAPKKESAVKYRVPGPGE